jgi:hypothetical protein
MNFAWLCSIFQCRYVYIDRATSPKIEGLTPVLKVKRCIALWNLRHCLAFQLSFVIFSASTFLQLLVMQPDASLSGWITSSTKNNQKLVKPLVNTQSCWLRLDIRLWRYETGSTRLFGSSSTILWKLGKQHNFSFLLLLGSIIHILADKQFS